MIGKYAVLLSISYLIEFAFARYIKQIDFEHVSMSDRGLIYATPLVLSFALNIITTFFVYRDKVTKKIETKYVIAATLLYRPVGVVAFLLYAIYGKYIGDITQTNITPSQRLSSEESDA